MDRFQEMQVFVRIAERRSFSLASEDLQIPRATVTNLLKRMELRLGVRLLERTTRHVQLTHDGEAYFYRCQRLLNDLDEAEGSFRNIAPKGLLRVNLQGTLARHFVVPGLNDFLLEYPDIKLYVGEDDRIVDLVREGIDCVLRAGVLPDSTLIGRQVALLEQVTVASPSYLDRYGIPQKLEELRNHFAVDYVSSVSRRPARLEFQDGIKSVSYELTAKISVNGADLYTGAAIAGLGLVQVPRYRIEKELAEDRLRIILSDWGPPPMPVSVLYPQSRQLSVRVRAFAQWIAARFNRLAPSPIKNR